MVHGNIPLRLFFFTKLHVSGRYIYILYSNVLNCIHLLAICFKLQLFIPTTKMVKARSFWRTHRGYMYAHGIVNALVMFLLIYHCSNFCLKIPWLDKMIYAPYCSLNPLVIEFTKLRVFFQTSSFDSLSSIYTQYGTLFW